MAFPTDPTIKTKKINQIKYLTIHIHIQAKLKGKKRPDFRSIHINIIDLIKTETV